MKTKWGSSRGAFVGMGFFARMRREKRVAYAQQQIEKCRQEMDSLRPKLNGAHNYDDKFNWIASFYINQVKIWIFESAIECEKEPNEYFEPEILKKFAWWLPLNEMFSGTIGPLDHWKTINSYVKSDQMFSVCLPHLHSSLISNLRLDMLESKKAEAIASIPKTGPMAEEMARLRAEINDLSSYLRDASNEEHRRLMIAIEARHYGINRIKQEYYNRMPWS